MGGEIVLPRRRIGEPAVVDLSAADGAKRAEYRLACPPVFDGLIAAGGRLYMSMIDDTVLCFAGNE